MKGLAIVGATIAAILALSACDDGRERSQQGRVAPWAETCVREQMSGLKKEGSDLAEVKSLLGAVMEYPPKVKPISLDDLRGLRFAAKGEERMILCPVTYDAYIFNPLARPLMSGPR